MIPAVVHMFPVQLFIKNIHSRTLPGREFLAEVYGPEDVNQNPYMRFPGFPGVFVVSHAGENFMIFTIDSPIIINNSP
jgi:hypothetical protein